MKRFFLFIGNLAACIIENVSTRAEEQQLCKTYRLRAASLFSVVRRAKREIRKWPRACIALTKSEEKERLLAVYKTYSPRSELFRTNHC